MKKIMVFVSVLFFATFIWAADNACMDSSTVKGNDDFPWPWGSEIKLPWARIQGVWGTSNGNCQTLFIFKTGKATPSGERLIEITQYDPAACRVLAKGIGIETGRFVSARMVGGRKTFDLAIRAFNSSDLSWSGGNTKRGEISGGDGQLVYVLHMYPVGRWNDRVGYTIEKYTPSANMVCEKM